jgi:phosphatidylglycerophosphate synthase
MSWITDYNSSLKMKEVEEIFDLYFYRPLAYLLVKVIYRTSITPNNLTVAALVMGIIGGCFYALGSRKGLFMGALFYLLFNILDCSDGQLARLKRNGTATGRIIDGVADYLAAIAIYTGIGIGFASHADHPYKWWGLLALTAVSIIIQGILVDFYRSRFLDYVHERKNTFKEGLDEYRKEYEMIRIQKNKWFDRIIIYVYLKYSYIQMRITLRKGRKVFLTNPQEYYRKNKLAIRLWVLIGPSAQITTLILCSLFNRLDIFFWVILLGFNGMAAVDWLIQQGIDRSFNTMTE